MQAREARAPFKQGGREGGWVEKGATACEDVAADSKPGLGQPPPCALGGAASSVVIR